MKNQDKCACPPNCACVGCCCPDAACCGPDTGCTPSAAECPIEEAAGCWDGAFMQAMREAKVEILKGKILAAWGPMLEQGADGVIEAMEATWQSKIAAVRAHEAGQAFRAKLRDLWDGDASQPS